MKWAIIIIVLVIALVFVARVITRITVRTYYEERKRYYGQRRTKTEDEGEDGA